MTYVQLLFKNPKPVNTDFSFFLFLYLNSKNVTDVRSYTVYSCGIETSLCNNCTENSDDLKGLKVKMMKIEKGNALCFKQRGQDRYQGGEGDFWG